MKSLIKYFLAGIVVLFIAGCSQTRQFVDASWTQKPSKMKILFSDPKFSGSIELPESMEPVADWFKEKVDNTLKFNSNVPYDVAYISKKEFSYVKEDMDGVEVQIPKVESMSDSFDVFVILDGIEMKLNDAYGQRSLYVGGVASDPNSCALGGVVPAPGCYNYTFKKGENTYGSANYVVYDVKTGKRLAYGHLDEKIQHEEVALEHGWYETVRQLVLRIIEKTPIAQF